MVWLSSQGFCGFERKCCPHIRRLLCLQLPAVQSSVLHGGQREAWGCSGSLGTRGVQESFRNSCGEGLRQAAFSRLYWKPWDHAISLQESFRWNQCQRAKHSTSLVLQLKHTKCPTLSAINTPGTVQTDWEAQRNA